MTRPYVRKVTLNEHLELLNQNSRASNREIASLRRRISDKFRDCGYPNAAKRDDLVDEYINMIFETQNYRCTHWLRVGKGEYNGVWNRPFKGYRGWLTDRVMYEVDHVHPRNAGGKDELTNYQFLSANANQFVKCSLTYDDLLCRVDLSARLKRRIRTVLARRRKLFKSEKWTNFMAKMEDTKRPIFDLPKL